MKIAATYENGNIFQHFGHTEQFKVYDVEDGKIVSSEVIGTDGNGHGALAGVLGGLHVEALICGGIGGGGRHQALRRRFRRCRRGRGGAFGRQPGVQRERDMQPPRRTPP